MSYKIFKIFFILFYLTNVLGREGTERFLWSAGKKSNDFWKVGRADGYTPSKY